MLGSAKRNKHKTHRSYNNNIKHKHKYNKAQSICTHTKRPQRSFCIRYSDGHNKSDIKEFTLVTSKFMPSTCIYSCFCYSKQNAL